MCVNRQQKPRPLNLTTPQTHSQPHHLPSQTPPQLALVFPTLPQSPRNILSTVMPASRDVEEEPGVHSASLRVAATATSRCPTSRSEQTSRSASTTTSTAKPAKPPPIVARPKKQRTAKQIAATARLSLGM